MDRELQSVAFAEKTGLDKRMVPKIAGTGLENIVWVVGWSNRCEASACCTVLRLVMMWLEK